MRGNRLGRLYLDGELVVRKGETADSMFLVQKGVLDVFLDDENAQSIGTLNSGEFFGEMSLFTGEPRSATIRSEGESRVLTIDKEAFMHRVKEDPMLAFRMLESLCLRMCDMNAKGSCW